MHIPLWHDLLLALGWMLLHMALWTLMGLGMLKALKAESVWTHFNLHLRFFVLMGLGWSGQLMALFLAGAVGLLFPGWVLVACLPLAFYGFRGLRLTTSVSSTELLPQIALALFTLGYVLQFAIRAPGYWDDTSFHLPIARFYLENGGLPVAEHLRFPLFPQHMNLIMAQGLYLQGELLAQMFSTWPLWLLLLGLYGAARHWLVSPLAGFLTCMAPFLLLPVMPTLGYAYTDLGLASMAFGGALVLMLILSAQKRQISGVDHPGMFLIGGWLLGTAASMKLFGLVWAIGWLTLCLLHAGLRRGIGWILLGCLLTGTGWYLRALVISADPFHPLLGDRVGHYLWSAEDLAGQRAEQATHGVGAGLLPLWPAFEKAGVIWIFPALFAGLFLLRKDRGLGLGWFAFLGYVVFWMKAGQVERYLAPAIGLGCLLSVVTLWRFGLERMLRRIQRAKWTRHVGVLAIAQMLILVPFTKAEWVDAPARLTAWGQWLQGRTGYSLYQAAHQAVETSMPAKLVQVGFENGIYFFNGTVMGDWFGPGRYSQFIVCTDKCRMGPAKVVAGHLDRLEVRLLLVNTQRFPIDMADYGGWFDVVTVEAGGVLLKRAPQRETVGSPR